jgi:hypothetical protein
MHRQAVPDTLTTFRGSVIPSPSQPPDQANGAGPAFRSAPLTASTFLAAFHHRNQSVAALFDELGIFGP